MDIALLNGRIIDPETRTEAEANVYIKDGRIQSIGKETLAADQVLDASGLLVCPGFIDIHMHREDEIGPDRGRGVSKTNEMGWLEAAMGVTTAIGGNCGMGPPSFEKYMGVIEKIGTPINYMAFSGHAIIREVCGQTDRYTPAAPDTIRAIAEHVRQALEEGAVGLSIGLEYTPGASFEELLGVVRPLADFPGALISIHYRYDADRALESIGEIVALADESKIPVQVSHLNSCAAFGSMTQALKKLETAIEGGTDLSIDSYPYDAFCTFLGAAVFDPGCLERWNVDYDALLVATGSHAGERFNAQLFEKLRQEEPNTLVVAFVMQEAEVEQAIAHPLTMVASDGLTVDRQGHPRGAGTFPRVLGLFSRQKGLFDLMEAIRKMTLLPADRLGLTRKGRVQEGADADLVVFDAATIIDRATFEEPLLPPTGIRWVLVNGKVVIEDNARKCPDAGQVIRRVQR